MSASESNDADVANVVPNCPLQLPSSFWFCLSVAMFLRFHLAHSAGEAWKKACAPYYK